MELIEGESLDRKVKPGGLGLNEVFDIGTAVAEALATAHDRGIVHRDLKPANVMLTRDSRVKVLDFGLAKLAAGTEAESVSKASTRHASLTGEGAVVGTVPYMSPEQLSGKHVDHRTDIFSLGVMLYELAVGRRPFVGDSSAELTSSIMRDTPRPVNEVRQDVPRHLGRIIGHCLEKDPRDRFQTSRDVFNELRGLRKEVESVTSVQSGVMSARPAPPSAATTSGVASGPSRSRSGLMAIGAVILMAAIGVALWKGRAPSGSIPEQTPGSSGPSALTPAVAANARE